MRPWWEWLGIAVVAVCAAAAIGWGALLITGPASHPEPHPAAAVKRPPAAVVAAMLDGRRCWLETDYRIRRGQIDAPRSEWLCR